MSLYLFSKSALDQYIDDLIEQWAEKNISTLRKTDSGFILKREQKIRPLIAWQPDGQRQPDQVLSVNSSFGNWNLSVWMPMRDKVSHRPEILLPCWILSAILCTIAFFQTKKLRAEKQELTAQATFLTRVSHDLRTPLTNLRLSIDLAEQQCRDLEPEKAAKRLSLAANDIDQINLLLENALQFSRGHRPSAIELASVKTIADDIIQSFGPSLENQQIKLEVTDLTNIPDLLHINTSALRRILSNLIANARKHAASGHWIGVDFEHHAEKLKIVISDHGPGLSDSLRKTIESTRTLKNSQLTDTQGTGLGLRISDELARSAEGSLKQLKSSQGLSLEVILPATIHSNKKS